MKLSWFIILMVACGVVNANPMIVRSGGNAVEFPRNGAASVKMGTSLECRACRGEYESLSAVVSAEGDLMGVMATPSDLTGTGGRIPSSAIDIRIVRWWYQGKMVDMLRNHPVEYSPIKVLTPELLLRDDALVKVDPAKQDNYLRDTRSDGTTNYLLCSDPDSSNLANVRPIDARRLQPVDILAGTSREYWINVHVPSDIAAGRYTGLVRFTARGCSVDLPLRVSVNDFDLEPSRLIYSIYYRGYLAADGRPTVESNAKSEHQYRTEIVNMRDHGVLHPNNYQGMTEKGTFDDLRRTLRIRREAGLPAGDFYTLGCGAGDEKNIPRWVQVCREYGYDKVFFYGADEAEGDALIAQRAAWKVTQDLGGRTFVATYSRSKAYETMGSLLDLAVISGLPNPENAKNWHEIGSRCFAYLCPQVGVEDPRIYRRNFGLLLAKSGHDGAMDYAYQHSFHHIWDDFDDTDYRDHVFAYPTIDGVVDTIQWEGFREAVDDVRYLTTMERAISQAEVRNPGLASKARSWLEGIPTDDSDGDRRGMIGWIMRLRR
jgi:hypothetical protein